MVFGCVPGTDPTANNGLAGRRPRRIHPHPRAHGHRENLGCVSLVHQSLNVRDFSPDAERCRVLYVSPIKALAVDVERNLRAPLIGISQAAQRLKLRITKFRLRYVQETLLRPSARVSRGIRLTS